MAATDPQTLLSQAKCYLCLGISMAEALQLALLAQIVSNGGTGGGARDNYLVAVNPNGVTVGAKGDMAFNTVNQTLWINTDGNVAWTQLI